MSTIYLTRHAYSCANYKKDLLSHIKVHRKKDPSITMWGVYGSLLLSQKEPFNITKPRLIVYVSCLIRTWQTAVVLYNRCAKLDLIVSPFAKEENNIKGLNEDNKPNKVEYQCIYFLYFLNTVKQYIQCKEITIYIAGQGTIQFTLDTEWKLKTDINTLYDYKNKTAKKITHKKNLKTIRTCIDYIPDNIKPAQFDEYKKHLDENIQQCISKDAVHPIATITQPYISYSPEFLESNTDKFISWLISQPTIDNEYRCILHSHIIRAYTLNHFGIDKESNPCSNQNLWTLKLNVSKNNYIEEGTLYEGLPKPNTKLLIHENELICNQGLGGKNKSKKNKKYK